MAADALSPIELEVCLHKTSDRADEIIDTVLLSFSDCQSFVAVTEVEYGIQVVGIYVWGIKRSDLFVGRANDVKRFAVQ